MDVSKADVKSDTSPLEVLKMKTVDVKNKDNSANDAKEPNLDTGTLDIGKRIFSDMSDILRQR